MSNPYPLYIYEIQAGRLPGWGYEPIRITIPAHTFDEVFEDLPVEVRISANSGANHADLSHIFATMGSDTNRKRICVTAGDGMTPCPVEINVWSTATSTATLTVTVPLVNPGEDTHLYLYYDPEHAEMTDWVTDILDPDSPTPPPDGPRAYIYPIACAATDVAVYQQDLVIHRSEGTSYEETVGGLKVWHVYVGNRCKSDYGDVRFTDAAGAALDYYLWPDYTSSSARFTVRLAGADVVGELLVWYGNPSATTTSNRDTTYLFSEVFPTGALDSSKWTEDAVGAITDSRTGDGMNKITGGTSSSGSYWVYDTTGTGNQHHAKASLPASYTIEWENSLSNTAPSGMGQGGVALLTSANKIIVYAGHGDWSGTSLDSIRNIIHEGESLVRYNGYTQNGTYPYATKKSAGNSESVPIQIRVHGNDVAVTIDNELACTFTKKTAVARMAIVAGVYGGYPYVSSIGISNLRVRAYSANPPSATAFGPEQEVVTPSDVYLVYDAAPAPLTLAAYVDAYEYLSWTRRYRRPGAWKCQINRYLPAAKEFVPGRLVHFRRNGEDRLGLIETRQISVDTRGRPSEVWTVAGREIIGILGDRLCLHGVSTGTGYDEFAGAAETALRHYVDANAINPDDARRIVPFLALSPTDDGRGGTTTQKARFDVLADLLESICAASGLGYRGRWSWDDRRLYFEVINGVDRSDSVKLSPALGNCTIKGYNESTGLAPSVAVVAGQGEAAARVVVDVGTGDGLIGLARRERFVDARDLATEAELEQRGAEKLAEDGDTTTLEVEYIRTASYRYGEDFDLGDIVHVEYPDIAAMDARIVAITEEYTREGERLTLTLGTEWPDLVSLLRAQRKDNVEKRV